MPLTNFQDPAGLVPILRDGAGSPTVFFPVRVLNATPSIYRGDVLARVATGDVVPLVTPGTDLIGGVAHRHKLTGTGDGVIDAVTDPDSIFETLCVGGAFALTNIGNTANTKIDNVRGAANVEGNISGHSLNGAAIGVLATTDLKIVGAILTEYNVVGANAAILVKINKHWERAGVAGI